MKRLNMFKSTRFSDVPVYVDAQGEVFDSPEKVGYLNYSLTEQAGYKPPRLQVLDFLTAGERLVSSVREKYYQSDLEPVFDDSGDIVLPKLSRSYDPLTAKRSLDDFNEKLSTYKELVYKRKQEEYDRRVSEQQKYKDFYDANHDKNSSDNS